LVTSSSYRVKFRKQEFLELVDIAKPRISYHTGRMQFFRLRRLRLYTFKCKDGNFNQKVIRAIEFSNYKWSE